MSASRESWRVRSRESLDDQPRLLPKATRVKIRERLGVLLAFAFIPSFTAAFSSYYASVSLGDFTQFPAWILVIGVIVIAGVVLYAWGATGLGLHKALAGIAVGLVIVAVAFFAAWAVPAPVANVAPPSS